LADAQAGSEHRLLICVCHIRDNVLIFSRSLDEHKRHVRLVLERLRANGLFAKPEKCAFHQTEIEYLGYLVSPDGVKMDPKKVSAVVDWPEPTNVTQLQAFLVWCYAHIIPVRRYDRRTHPNLS
jgi:hypothetical protein